ncbi:MAG TPA: IS110 family transposase [Blastocatellia bacterium]|nr:IS110 family transposase [Blastocatellia bacterium]
MRFIGVDLHSNQLTVCYLTTSGQQTHRTFALKDLADFQKTLRRSDRLAVEATGNTRWFVSQVKACVAAVVVVNPNQFEVIRKSVKKTDRHDARALALFLSKELLPEARLKSERAAEINSLATTRDKLVKLRTTLVNKLHALHRERGWASRKSQFLSARGLAAVLAREWSETTSVEVEVIVSQIGALNGGIKRLDVQLAASGAELRGQKNLVSIKGIGPRAAAILLAVIGEIEDFSSAAKLASYFGIVPRVSNSNAQVQHGRITKRGSKLGRTCLVQCTLVAKKYSPYLGQYYEKIKAKKGGGKAIIATARKFLGIIYRTLKNDWVFEDFPNFVLAEG